MDTSLLVSSPLCVISNPINPETGEVMKKWANMPSVDDVYKQFYSSGLQYRADAYLKSNDLGTLNEMKFLNSLADATDLQVLSEGGLNTTYSAQIDGSKSKTKSKLLDEDVEHLTTSLSIVGIWEEARKQE